MVGPVSIPAADDQPQFVTQVASNRVEVDEFSRWAAPLSDSIARAVAGDLAVLLGTPDVAIAPLAARFLGISRPSIYRKMARYGLRRSGVQERGVTPNRAPPFS